MRIHPSSNKLALTVIKEDITKVRAEGVVTGEGTKLDKESDVTKSLISVLPHLQGIRSNIRDDGGLDLWTAHVSPLGSSSRFQYVIHAVLDKGNNDQWLRFMKALYKNIFKEADSYEISSIALPVLGSGTAGADTALSIQALVISVLTYTSSYLTKVKVVSLDQDLLDRVKDQITYEEYECSIVEPSICNPKTIWFRVKDFLSPYSYYDESKNSCRYGQVTNRDHGGHNGHQHAPDREYRKHQSQRVQGDSGEHLDNSQDIDDGKRRGSGRGRRQRGQDWRSSEEYCQVQIALKVSREEASASGVNQKEELQYQNTFQNPDEYSVRNRKRQETKGRTKVGLQQNTENGVFTRKVQDDNSSIGTSQQFEGATASVNKYLQDVKSMEDHTYLKLTAEHPHSPVLHDLTPASTTVNYDHCLGIRTIEDNAKAHESKTDSILTCPICLSAVVKPKKLDKCGHVFCQDCIDQSFQDYKPVCPSCNMVYGVITGNQPEGNMDIRFSSQSLPGYEHHGTFTITYRFPSGIQKEGHPKPGKLYKGTTRRAYLPDCREGREVLDLLRTAFDRKLTFTVGRSTTTGQENVVTWNDIHHKTNMDGGPTRFGYPDPTYLARVRDELASKGVTQTPPNF